MDDPSKQDRISNLPDNMIHSILSTIDMKYAVQTCVLSKRWQYIWKSLPFLNFDMGSNTYSRQQELFVRFVYMVLLYCDNGRILRFHLNLRRNNISASHICTWIGTALRRNVEELCIINSYPYYSSSADDKIFSNSLLGTCKSLTKLELDLGSMGFTLGSKNFPSLKSMSLRFDYISVDQAEFANSLFTKCPALESLVLEYNGCHRLTNLNISLPKLKHVCLGSPDQIGLWKVTLCAPNLTSLICFVNLLEDYCLESLSSLVTADVRIRINPDDKASRTVLNAATRVSYAKSMVKLLRGLHNVKVLELTSDFKVLSGALEILDCQLPVFPNLQRLILTTWLSKGCKDAIFYLLQKSPNIEFLTLNIEPMFLDESRGQELPLPFRLDHLKHIVIRGLGGYGNELEFIKIMLKNSMALEKVVLFSNPENSRSENNTDSKNKKRWRKFKASVLAYEAAGSKSIISFDS